MDNPSPILFFGPATNGGIVASATIHVDRVELPALRAKIAATFPRVPASQLKHAEEQTIAGLAVLADEAMLAVGSRPEWGVVVVAENLGRARLQEVVPKFRAGGPWSVSPHFIPHCLLHSPPGLISQALGTIGPAIGVGGSQSDMKMALSVVGAWFAADDCPGAWVIHTVESEPITATAIAFVKTDALAHTDAVTAIVAAGKGAP